MNNTTQSAIGKSTSAEPMQIVEFFLRLTNTGETDARNVHFRVFFSSTYEQAMHPRVEITANNVDTFSDSVTVNSTTPSILSYHGGHAMIAGVTDLYNCPNMCPLPENFHVYPLNIGNIKPGESKTIQIKFKADVFPNATPTPTPGPGCNTSCHSNSDCRSEHFCYKPNGGDTGMCRLPAKQESITCENDNEGGFIVMKYHDKNGDGSRQSEEPGLDWEFEWDLCRDNNNCDNAWQYQGTYITYASKNGEGGRVGGLKNGDKVRIREKSKTGWIATTATNVILEIHQNETVFARFGNRTTQPTVVTTPPPTSLPKTGVDLMLPFLSSMGLGGLGLYLRRKFSDSTRV
jgi:hypothetical protein